MQIRLSDAREAIFKDQKYLSHVCSPVNHMIRVAQSSLMNWNSDGCKTGHRMLYSELALQIRFGIR